MPQQGRSDRRACQPDPVPSAPAGQGDETPLRFDATAVVRGIVYHLLDEGIALEIRSDSVVRSIRRLERAALSLTIPRGRWGGMNNRQRLEWLLSQSHTATLLLSGRVVMLGTEADC